MDFPRAAAVFAPYANKINQKVNKTITILGLPLPLSASN